MHCGYFYTSSFFGITFSQSLSLSLSVYDVGFGNNKWLDVFRCHVKPGAGHVLSEHTTTAGGSPAPRSGYLGAHSLSQGTGLQQNGSSARLASLAKGNYV